MPFVQLPRFQDQAGGRHAAIAFAVRCAKRVEPLLDGRLPDEDREIVAIALDMSDQEARGKVLTAVADADHLKVLVRTQKGDARHALEAAMAALEAAGAGGIAGWVAANTPKRVPKESDAEFEDRQHDYYKALSAKSGECSKSAWQSAIHASVKAYDAGQTVGADLSSEIRGDFLILAEYCRTEVVGPYNVHQSVFGPMWRNGVPLQWKKALVREGLKTLPFQAYSLLSQSVPAIQDVPSKADRALCLQILHQVVCDRFDEPGLKELLWFRLNVRLDHVVSGENFRHTALQLIEWADQRGRLADLARAMMAERPGLLEVQDVCSQVINTFG